MAKRRQKKTTEPAAEPEPILGHDPFEGMDKEWLEREEGELEIQVLGHDPFADMDVSDWMEQTDNRASTSLLLGGANAHPLPPTGVPVPKMLIPERAVWDERYALGQVVVDDAELTPALEEQPPPAAPAEAAIPAATPPLPPAPLPEAQPVTPVPAPRPLPMATFHFPAGFKWGVAVAAHQVEGENTQNDWWAWEQQAGRIKDGSTSGLACNWWRNAEADFDRAAKMGLNALRLSVEWSRIEPRPGVFDEAALGRYAQMLQGLRQRNIEPMVTLHHFSSPRWLAEQGGWESPETIALFTRFVGKVVEALGRYCDLWCTINEPNVYSFMGYVDGVFPPGKNDFGAATRVLRNMLTAHAAAYRQIHAIQPTARVGLAHNMRVLDPRNPASPLDHFAARMADNTFNQAILTALTKGRWILPIGFGFALKLRRTLDWIGLNYYTRDVVAFDRTQPGALFTRRQRSEGAELLDGGYGEFYPQGMFRCIQRLARLGLPIYVTENGTPDSDDDQRPRHLLAHLNQMWHAIQFCYPVMGYYHWTLVDNFEWAEGWGLRFGLIEMDPETQARRMRRSANLYGEAARANAITPQMIDAYAPRLRSELLPG